MIAPSVEAVAEEFDGRASFYKMNVDENPAVPDKYGIRGIPTLILFKGGVEQERIVGAVSREAIAKVVSKYAAAAEAAGHDSHHIADECEDGLRRVGADQCRPGRHADDRRTL